MTVRLLRDAKRPDRRGRVAAAHHGQAVHRGHRLGDRAGAGGERGELEHPDRAVPEHRLGVGQLLREQGPGLRARVYAFPVGREGGHRHHGVLRVGREVGGRDQVDRQHQLDATPFGLFHDLLDRGDLVGLEHRVAHLVAAGGQERVPHAAADDDAVRQAQQVADHGELVRGLLAAEHYHEGPRRVGGQLAQHRHLVPYQVARGVRKQPGQVVDRGVLAMHGAEPVAHVQLAEAGQPLGEGAALGVVLAGLRGLEAHVLQHRDVLVTQAEHGLLGRGPGHVSGEETGRPSSSPSRAATGRSDGPPAARSSKVAPLGRPRCARMITRAPRSESLLITGRLARIRPSSVISPVPVRSSGTFRSDRSSTRRPRTSRSSMDRITAAGRRRARPGRRAGWSSPTRCRTSR